MSQQTLDYQIDNVGGVAHAELQLAPGVNCLRGRNGVGKTSAMRAIARAQGGEVELERRDGSDHGQVRGPGVLLRVGKVVTKKGDAELELADVSPLAVLIEPGLKDTDAAARARVRALVELLGLPVDDDAIATLCSGDESLGAWLEQTVREEAIDDLTIAAEKLRHHANALAKAHEKVAGDAAGRAGACADRARECLEALEGNADRVAVAVANAALVDGSRQYERAVTQCEARETLEAQQAELRATLGERPDLEAATAAVQSAETAVEAAQAEVTRLEALLAGAKAALTASAREAVAQRAARERAVKAAQLWDEAQAILARTPEGPTRDELPALKAALVDAASRRLQLARTAEEYHAAETERAAQDATRADAEREAKRLRDVAHQIQARLGDLLAKAGAPGLTVIGGRLHALVDGEPHDFERRLSEGQRVRAALDVAAHAYTGRVVPLDGHFWGALDPENQTEFARLAAERGLYILTESPTEGELRVEHVG